jgi:predicted deacylase
MLKTLTFGDPAARPHLLLTGGVHGDEFEPMIALRRLARFLEGAKLRGRVTLVPIVNEPAFARGHRVGDDGLDLARTCPGRADGTPTEQIAHALSALIRSADFYIDLHTGGTTLAVWPMTGYVLHPDPAVLEKQRALARAFNLPVIWGTDPTLPGRSLSVARDAGVPAIYAEYLGAAQMSPAGVQAYYDGCLNLLGHLNMLDRPTVPHSRILLVVEDPRESSGHMQRCYPSPADGCFESAVRLGDRIAAGDLLGRVVDSLGAAPHEVRAAESGWVLVLRTFCGVKEGDSLAVVLDRNYLLEKGDEWNAMANDTSEPADDVQSAWQRAVAFAARQHQGQVRKDGKTPYFAHPARVAVTVRHVFGEADEVALQAALLHDVIEDTTTDYDDLLEQFGREVADAVAALTKDSRMEHDAREAAYDQQLSAAAWQARLVKLADVYDNYSDARNEEERRKFVDKAERAIRCAGTDPRLERAIQKLRERVRE